MYSGKNIGVTDTGEYRMKFKSVLIGLLVFGLAGVVAAVDSGTASAVPPKWKCAKAPCEQPGPDTEPPSAPSNVTLQEVVVGDYWGVRLQWTASTDNYFVANYEVVRMDNNDHSVEGFMIPGSQTSYDDLLFRVNMGALVDYSYIVIAYDAYGNASAPSNEVHYPARAALDAEAVITNDRWGARLSWTTFPELGAVDHFTITRNSNISETAEEIVVPGNQTSYNDLMFRINTGVSAIYYYTITAYDEHNNFMYTSNTAVFDTDNTPTGAAMITTNLDGGSVLREYAEVQTDVLNFPDIDRVEFYIEDYLVNTSYEAAPLFYLDTYGYADGEHEFTIRVYDSNNNFIEKTITITISNYDITH